MVQKVWQRDTVRKPNLWVRLLGIVDRCWAAWSVSPEHSSEREVQMPAVARLVTFVDVDEQGPAGTISVSARHEAELVDGSRVLLLNDRGWGSSGGWATTSVEDVKETTRTVVGPDEPPDGRSYDDEEAAHWALLQQVAQRRGVAVDAAELKQLPHDVVLGQRVLARISGNPDSGDSG